MSYATTADGRHAIPLYDKSWLQQWFQWLLNTYPTPILLLGHSNFGSTSARNGAVAKIEELASSGNVDSQFEFEGLVKQYRIDQIEFRRVPGNNHFWEALLTDEQGVVVYQFGQRLLQAVSKGGILPSYQDPQETKLSTLLARMGHGPVEEWETAFLEGLWEEKSVRWIQLILNAVREVLLRKRG